MERERNEASAEFLREREKEKRTQIADLMLSFHLCMKSVNFVAFFFSVLYKRN